MDRKGVNWFAVFARRNANRHQAQKMRFAMQMAPAPEWADFLQYCGRALRARSLRFLIPPTEAFQPRRHLAKNIDWFHWRRRENLRIKCIGAQPLYCAHCARTKPSSRRIPNSHCLCARRRDKTKPLQAAFPLLLLYFAHGEENVYSALIPLDYIIKICAKTEQI